MPTDLKLVIEWLLVAVVIVAAVPLVVACYQFVLVALHGGRNHYSNCAPYFPRTAILIPAWNEGAVLGNAIERLMALEYPPDRLRVVVVDDASTDDTAEVLAAEMAAHPGRVTHLRRSVGGEGKAQTLNVGLAAVLEDDWMEALLIMDADVIFEPSSLRMMTRHLADSRVGAVTAYIKEGSRPGNYMTRFVGFEYVTAQAAARRAQNVLGVLACLAGGAQLHTRQSIEAIGGRIDTSTLAEDTFTTFAIQEAGLRVVFEPHAVVWAEEPGSIEALWKQRLRWARGNVQLTKHFSGVWFHKKASPRLGSFSFGLIWFSVFLLPLLMIAASISLVSLYALDATVAWETFRFLWIINVVSFVFITSYSLIIDPEVAGRCWREAILFPGVVSLIIILYTCFPKGVAYLVEHLSSSLGVAVTSGDQHLLALFAFVWLGACMLVAWAAKGLEHRFGGKVLSPLFVYVGGYGPLLCAVAVASFVKELRHADQHWEKTEKTGKVSMPR